jgi:hypothetical protein
MDSRRNDSTLPYKYLWETKWVKFFALKLFYIIECVDAESFRVQHGFAMNEEEAAQVLRASVRHADL